MPATAMADDRNFVREDVLPWAVEMDSSCSRFDAPEETSAGAAVVAHAVGVSSIVSKKFNYSKREEEKKG